ncbi:hypothetical protein CCHL11_10397 [Colletotrichum chlorophyti]|uniref:Uncharacterized protein n=1 Tax=Colletotrichum chlorophyti TaxID=708187 RepID=A0A1Q8S1E4_9PEZI|nr:hypothetical protein CCHL11_10397 [Colletotrichum chlorophyti]
MEPIENSPVVETFRLGMISYMTTLCLQMRSVKFRFVALANNLREGYQKIGPPELCAPNTRLVIAWTLKPEKNLQSFMWIGNVHDTIGLKVYQRLVFHITQIPTESFAGSPA